jgi:hypothetical protein
LRRCGACGVERRGDATGREGGLDRAGRVNQLGKAIKWSRRRSETSTAKSCSFHEQAPLTVELHSMLVDCWLSDWAKEISQRVVCLASSGGQFSEGVNLDRNRRLLSVRMVGGRAGLVCPAAHLPCWWQGGLAGEGDYSHVLPICEVGGKAPAAIPWRPSRGGHPLAGAPGAHVARLTSRFRGGCQLFFCWHAALHLLPEHLRQGACIRGNRVK